MPFIQIKSLPLDQPTQIPEVLCALNRNLAQRCGIDLNHLHSTWEYFDSGHYAKGERVPSCQPSARQPILVELLTPDFTEAAAIRTMLTTIAATLAENLPFSYDNIFINHRPAHSGTVFDDGRIIDWD